MHSADNKVHVMCVYTEIIGILGILQWDINVTITDCYTTALLYHDR